MSEEKRNAFQRQLFEDLAREDRPKLSEAFPGLFEALKRIEDIQRAAREKARAKRQLELKATAFGTF